MNPLLRIEYDRICRIIKRVNKFKVEVLVDDKVEYAYTNNTGRLLEYLARDKTVYCIERSKPGKTRYRLFAVDDLGGKAALIDTGFQMKAFEEAVSRKLIPWLRSCRIVKRNPRLGSSVLDYLLECDTGRVYVEIKSAVFRGDHIYAMYPDCPTLRGRRHIRELIVHVSKGGIGAIIFIAALPGVKAFKPYVRGDPEIPGLLVEAERRGVMVKAINMYYDPDTRWIILVDPDLPVVLGEHH